MRMFSIYFFLRGKLYTACPALGYMACSDNGNKKI